MRAVVLCLGLVLAACGAGGDRRIEGVKSLAVDRVAALRAAGTTTIVDANGADTRRREGVVPGAVLLSDYKQYDVAKELPADRATPLVFYCANEH